MVAKVWASSRARIKGSSSCGLVAMAASNCLIARSSSWSFTSERSWPSTSATSPPVARCWSTSHVPIPGTVHDRTGPPGTRTRDQPVMSRPLRQLSDGPEPNNSAPLEAAPWRSVPGWCPYRLSICGCARPRSPSSTVLYRLNTAMVLCPVIFITVNGSTPARRALVTKVCRRSWKVAPVTWARLHAAAKACPMLVRR